MQRTESCDDQERKVREGLGRLGIDHRQAKVIRDEAESGTTSRRTEFAGLLKMIRAGEVGILAVDDQGRFSRADNAFAMIKDLVFDGDRFISAGEGVDTDQIGWELRVKVMELHHSTTIRELGRRVRRGLEGRVLDGNGSAGDYPFGYRSEYLDPNWAELLAHRGPKPKKQVVIYEQEATSVRDTYRWFVGGMSIGAIGRKLTGLGVDKGHRSWKSGWRHQIVRRMLGNAKYIGRWSWGRATTRRDSRGHKKQVPVDESMVTQKDRPDLRIIDDVTWNQAQKLLAKLHKIYGKKPGQPSRKARVHHTELYPSSLLSGLVFCGAFKCAENAFAWDRCKSGHRRVETPILTD